MENYKFSIVIPHLNEGYYLDIMLDSFYNYINYDNYEIIIVDDGTEDLSTLDFLENHFLKDKIKLYKNGHRGLPLTKNYGASKSSGEVLVFLDSHMYIKEDILEKLNIILNNNNNINLLQLCIWNIGVKSQRAEIYKIKDKELNSTWDYGDKNKDIVKTPNIAGGCTIVKKNVFDKLKWFNKYFKNWWAEDLDFSTRAILSGYELFLVRSIIINHYFKTSFTNTTIKSDEVLYNKLIFALTCFKNQERLDWILEALKKHYTETLFNEQYQLVINNNELMDYIKEIQSNFIFNDDWYFEKFKEYYKDF